jgi:hypothetical protein
MFTQEICEATCTDKSLKAMERFPQERQSARRLTELWLLAEYLQVLKLRNQAFNILRRRMIMNSNRSIPSYSLIYNKAAQGSMLRKFCTDIIVWKSFDTKIVLENRHLFSAEMLQDLWLTERERESGKLYSTRPDTCFEQLPR